MSEGAASTGRLEGIWLKRSHRGPMDAQASVRLVAGEGIAGSIDRSRRRQVTIISREVWNELMAALGAAVDPSARRANLLVSGVALAHTRGRVLRIGAGRLVIGGELTPCERMDEARPGLRELMRPDWRGGVFAQVLDDAVISVGDSVSWDNRV
jgi:MOSC domain-containing protein YiiM